MKRSLVLLSLCVVLFCGGFGGPAPQSGAGGSATSGDVYMIDDFEDGNFNSNPEWWRFDNVTVNVVSNAEMRNGDPSVAAGVGKLSLSVTGNASDWYAGGIGTYIARKGVDLGKYNAISIDIYGYGPGSGSIKIELVDDDKGNWQVEQDSRGVPLYDDKFAYTQLVDWSGWKRVVIPFSDFSLDNPGRGDGVLDISQRNGGGGLLQMQMIFIASKKIGSLRYAIDNISLVKK